MKRFSFASCALLFLLSCTKQGALAPRDVLQRATVAAQTLQSAHFDADATFSGKVAYLGSDASGTAHASGILVNGGKQLQFSVQGSLQKTNGDSPATNIALDSDIVVATENEVYMKLNTLTIDPENPLLPQQMISPLLNTWWQMSSASGSSAAAADVTPDPQMLRMQTSVIDVAKDKGLSTVDGHASYTYDVTINQDKLHQYLAAIAKEQGMTDTGSSVFEMLSAHGTMWIDAQSFVVRRIVWDLSSTDPTKPQTIHLDISLSKQNEPAAISIPADYSPFPGTSGAPFPFPTLPDSSSASPFR